MIDSFCHSNELIKYKKKKHLLSCSKTCSHFTHNTIVVQEFVPNVTNAMK